MRMKQAHGTSQYRLNHAKGHAQFILENTLRIEILWQMSTSGHVDKDGIDNAIRNLIDENDRMIEEYRNYLKYREDMVEETK